MNKLNTPLEGIYEAERSRAETQAKLLNGQAQAELRAYDRRYQHQRELMAEWMDRFKEQGMSEHEAFSKALGMGLMTEWIYNPPVSATVIVTVCG
jgi:hypothetical protein